MIPRVLASIGLLSFAFFATFASLSSAQVEPIELVIGVRADAAPFSFARNAGPRFNPPGTGPLFDKGYDGYVVQVCDVVLEALMAERSGITVRVVRVTAKTRFAALGEAEPKAEQIDILCDPATITKDRVKNHYTSVPVYLSGITFAYQDPFPGGELCASLIGAVAETTTETRGMSLILDSGKWPRYRAQIAEALAAPRQINDTPPAIPSDVDSSDGVCRRPVILWANDHDALARNFCDKHVLYYVGDVEIIRSKLKFLNENGACPFVIDNTTYTDERYALFARIPSDAGKASVVLRFFSILAEKVYTDKEQASSILIESYGRVFKDYRPSRRLQAFYWSLTGDTGVSE
ncbi:MAG: hypothetical protein DI533_10115 [Cereibacter sphaeroides]|uniref:Solute-binding protein family 3/N-terminal domain-containing protein n=1 Tax=Cereibacter sphaeroides TaxID=1063 RepID=A0A2W5SD62_CERSP|nr:MAG: hypothetical protein DI533_10115 [Cereibacter sphaeroides]